MKQSIKELLIKIIRINISGCLNRISYRAIMIALPKERGYQINNKSDSYLFIYDRLIKRRSICKIQYLH